MDYGFAEFQNFLRLQSTFLDEFSPFSTFVVFSPEMHPGGCLLRLQLELCWSRIVNWLAIYANCTFTFLDIKQMLYDELETLILLIISLSHIITTIMITQKQLYQVMS